MVAIIPITKELQFVSPPILALVEYNYRYIFLLQTLKNRRISNCVEIISIITLIPVPI